MTEAPTHKIGLISCIAFAVGTMVGAGVFVLSGVAVQKAGPAALLSFSLAGVFVLLSALSFSVVASLARPGESGYGYVNTSLGNYWGFITSWSFYLGGVIGAAFVLHAFGQYFHDFFWSGLSTTTYALLAAVLLTLLNLGPASAIGKAEVVLVGIKVAVLVLLIVFAFIHVDRAHFSPFAPHGAHSVVASSAVLFIAYLGFNVVTNMAGDVKNASRTVPLAILLSMLIVGLIYLGVVVALLAGQITTYDEASVGDAAKHLIGGWGGVLIPIGALVSTLSAANANILGSSEIMVRLAAKNEVPTIAGRLWHGHPVVSVLGGATLYVGFLLSGKTAAVITIANVAAIVAMILVNVAAIRAAMTKPEGGIRLPLCPVLPALGLLAAAVQVAFMNIWSALAGIALVFAGSIVYALKRHRIPDVEAELRAHLHHHNGPLGRALRRPV